LYIDHQCTTFTNISLFLLSFHSNESDVSLKDDKS
jgi:hypothetical protein